MRDARVRGEKDLNGCDETFQFANVGAHRGLILRISRQKRKPDGNFSRPTLIFSVLSESEYRVPFFFEPVFLPELCSFAAVVADGFAPLLSFPFNRAFAATGLRSRAVTDEYCYVEDVVPEQLQPPALLAVLDI